MYYSNLRTMETANVDRLYFQELCDYKNILIVTKQELLKKGLPLELVREVLLQVRNDLLSNLAMIVDAGHHAVSNIIFVEFVNAMNRMEPYKAMINLIKLRIGCDCSLTFPEDSDVPIEMPERLPKSLLNSITFRIHDRCMSSTWEELADPECGGFLCISGTIYRLINPEN